MGAFNKTDYGTLRRDGFTQWEVEKFFNATTVSGDPQVINIRTKVWQDMRRDRRNYVRDLKRRGWTVPQIRTRIYKYYQTRKDASPFDFLKVDYKPPRTIRESEYEKKLQVRKAMDRSLGRKYGKREFKTKRRA